MESWSASVSVCGIGTYMSDAFKTSDVIGGGLQAI